MKACIFDGRDTNEEVDGREMDGMKMQGTEMDVKGVSKQCDMVESATAVSRLLTTRACTRLALAFYLLGLFLQMMRHAFNARSRDSRCYCGGASGERRGRYAPSPSQQRSFRRSFHLPRTSFFQGFSSQVPYSPVVCFHGVLYSMDRV